MRVFSLVFSLIIAIGCPYLYAGQPPSRADLQKAFTMLGLVTKGSSASRTEIRDAYWAKIKSVYADPNPENDERAKEVNWANDVIEQASKFGMSWIPGTEAKAQWFVEVPFYEPRDIRIFTFGAIFENEFGYVFFAHPPDSPTGLMQWFWKPKLGNTIYRLVTASGSSSTKAGRQIFDIKTQVLDPSWPEGLAQMLMTDPSKIQIGSHVFNSVYDGRKQDTATHQQWHNRLAPAFTKVEMYDDPKMSWNIFDFYVYRGEGGYYIVSRSVRIHYPYVMTDNLYFLPDGSRELVDTRARFQPPGTWLHPNRLQMEFFANFKVTKTIPLYSKATNKFHGNILLQGLDVELVQKATRRHDKRSFKAASLAEIQSMDLDNILKSHVGTPPLVVSPLNSIFHGGGDCELIFLPELVDGVSGNPTKAI